MNYNTVLLKQSLTVAYGVSGVRSTCDSAFILNQKVKVKPHKCAVWFPPDMSHMTSASGELVVMRPRAFLCSLFFQLSTLPYVSR